MSGNKIRDWTIADYQKSVSDTLIDLLYPDVQTERTNALLMLRDSGKLIKRAPPSPIQEMSANAPAETALPQRQDQAHRATLVEQQTRKLKKQQKEAAEVVRWFVLPFLYEYDQAGWWSKFWDYSDHPIDYYRQLAVETLAQEELDKLVFNPQAVSHRVLNWLTSQLTKSKFYTWPESLQNAGALLSSLAQQQEKLSTYIEKNRQDIVLRGCSQTQVFLYEAIQHLLEDWASHKNYLGALWWRRPGIDVGRGLLDGRKIDATGETVNQVQPQRRPMRDVLQRYVTARENKWSSWSNFKTWFKGRFRKEREKQLALLVYYDATQLQQEMNKVNDDNPIMGEHRVVNLTDKLSDRLLNSLSCLGDNNQMRKIGSMTSNVAITAKQSKQPTSTELLQTTINVAVATLTKRFSATLCNNMASEQFEEDAVSLNKGITETCQLLSEQGDQLLTADVARQKAAWDVVYRLYTEVAKQIPQTNNLNYKIKVVLQKTNSMSPTLETLRLKIVILDVFLSKEQKKLNASADINSEPTDQTTAQENIDRLLALLKQYSSRVEQDVAQLRQSNQTQTITKELEQLSDEGCFALYEEFITAMRLLRNYYDAEIAILSRMENNPLLSALSKQMSNKSSTTILDEYERIVNDKAVMIGEYYLTTLGKSMALKHGAGLERANRLFKLYNHQQQLLQSQLQQEKKTYLRRLNLDEKLQDPVLLEEITSQRQYDSSDNPAEMVDHELVAELNQNIQTLKTQLKSYAQDLEKALQEAQGIGKGQEKFTSLYYGWYEKLKAQYHQLEKNLQATSGTEEMLAGLKQQYEQYAVRIYFYRGMSFWLDIVTHWQTKALMDIAAYKEQYPNQNQQETATGKAQADELKQQRSLMKDFIVRGLTALYPHAERMGLESVFSSWMAAIIDYRLTELEVRATLRPQNLAWKEQEPSLTLPDFLPTGYLPLMPNIPDNCSLSEVNWVDMMEGIADAQLDWQRYQALVVYTKGIVYQHLKTSFTPYQELGECRRDMLSNPEIQACINLLNWHHRQMHLKYHPDIARPIGEIWTLTGKQMIEQLKQRLQPNIQKMETWFQSHVEEIQNHEKLSQFKSNCMKYKTDLERFLLNTEGFLTTEDTNDPSCNLIISIHDIAKYIQVWLEKFEEISDLLLSEWSYERLALLGELQLAEQRVSNGEQINSDIIDTLKTEMNQTYHYGIVGIRMNNEVYRASETYMLSALPTEYERGYVIYYTVYDDYPGERYFAGVHYVDAERQSCNLLMSYSKIHDNQHFCDFLNNLLDTMQKKESIDLPQDESDEDEELQSDNDNDQKDKKLYNMVIEFQPRTLKKKEIQQMQFAVNIIPSGIPKNALVRAMAAAIVGDDYQERLFYPSQIIKRCLDDIELTLPQKRYGRFGHNARNAESYINGFASIVRDLERISREILNEDLPAPAQSIEEQPAQHQETHTSSSSSSSKNIPTSPREAHGTLFRHSNTLNTANVDTDLTKANSLPLSDTKSFG